MAETMYVQLADQPRRSSVGLTIVRRVRPTPGPPLALLTLYDCHPFITDREGKILSLEADHRRDGEVEKRDPGSEVRVGLNHLPSGRSPPTGLAAVCVIADNLARWTTRIGLGETLVTTKTLRRRLFGLVGCVTRYATRVTLGLPTRWP